MTVHINNPTNTLDACANQVEKDELSDNRVEDPTDDATIGYYDQTDLPLLPHRNDNTVEIPCTS